MPLTARRLSYMAIASILALIQTVVFPEPVLAADSPVSTGQSTTAIAGTVRVSDGAPLAGASIVATGPEKAQTSSNASGSFALTALPPGVYSVSVSKPGYQTVVRDEVTVTFGSSAMLNVGLSPISFTSLSEIGRTSTTSRAPFNTSTASISTVSNATFQEQGQHSVQQVLNEIPGIVTSLSGGASGGGGTNGADPATPQLPSIRGALPYETASLVDGHPVSVGTNGAFTPVYLNPWLLENIEVVKGPGALAPDINYAIGGSVNYRTLNPTRDFRFSIDLDADAYGGISSNYRASGTVNKLGFVLDYGVLGTPGANLGNLYTNGAAFISASNATLNGQSVCVTKLTNCPLGTVAAAPNYQGGYVLQQRIALCCYTAYQADTNKAELAKLRFAFSPQTSLTVSYLGGQSLFPWNGKFINYDTNDQFVPYAGYTGPTPPGGVGYGDRVRNVYESNQQNLGQAEFRTTFGSVTFLARYYSGSSIDLQYDHPFGTNWAQTYTAYGTIPLGPAGTLTNFNGVPVTIVSNLSNSYVFANDSFRGYSAEFDVPLKDNTVTVSYDRNTHASFAYNGYDTNLAANAGATIPAGSSETYQTILARGIFQLGTKVQATLSNYFVNYISHFTANGGTTFQDSVHSFFGPRFALSYRASPNTSLRASAGSSIAPPYISLLTVPSTPPKPNINGAPTFYTQQLSSGQIAPETSFGYNLGLDQRLGQVVFSGDIYLTNLKNQFLQATSAGGTYLNLPLYQLQTQNLGNSRYEGVEFSFKRSVARGFGFVAQGAFERAYAYNVPPSLYATANGAQTANLAVVPNVNFFPSGVGYNGVAYGRIPYATGYGEINYRARTGLSWLVGATYYGSNNSYNVPAFAAVNASIRYQLTKKSYLQLSGQNLTGAYDTLFASPTAGQPVPLINGKLGYTSLGNLGPATFHLLFHQDVGR